MGMGMRTIATGAALGLGLTACNKPAENAALKVPGVVNAHTKQLDPDCKGILNAALQGSGRGVDHTCANVAEGAIAAITAAGYKPNGTVNLPNSGQCEAAPQLLTKSVESPNGLVSMSARIGSECEDIKGRRSEERL